jgi:hypothetical protein
MAKVTVKLRAPLGFFVFVFIYFITFLRYLIHRAPKYHGKHLIIE